VATFRISAGDHLDLIFLPLDILFTEALQASSYQEVSDALN
jgi:hypothetical protein